MNRRAFSGTAEIAVLRREAVFNLGSKNLYAV